jgi:uncharacterized membrane protein
MKADDHREDGLAKTAFWILLVAAIVLGMVFSAYFINFSGHGFSSTKEDWGQFGDFVGGTANPVLAFLTLIALIITIAVQSRQLRISSKELELSRKELELTRDELRRSAEAQVLAEVSLRSQAEAAQKSSKMATINFLLEHYKSELEPIRRRMYEEGTVDWHRKDDLLRKEKALIGILNEEFEEISKENRE